MPSWVSLSVLVTELLPLKRFDFLRSSLLSCNNKVWKLSAAAISFCRQSQSPCIR